MFTNDAEFYMNHCAGDVELRAIEKHWSKLDIHETDRKYVLDIGCGTGNISKALAQTPGVHQMHAFDSSPHMILYAHKYCKGPNIRFYVDDVAFPKISGKKMYDIVFSNMTMHWIRHQLSALKNISAMLKPGGNLLLQMLVQPTQSRAAALRAIADERFWDKYLNGYNAEWIFNETDEENRRWLYPDPLDGYRALLERAGFRMLDDSEIIRKEEQLPVTDATVAFLKRRQAAISPHLERIPVKYHDQFMDTYIEAFVEALPRRGDNFVLNSKNMVVHAVKI